MARVGPCPHCGAAADFTQPFHRGEGGCGGPLVGLSPTPAHSPTVPTTPSETGPSAPRAGGSQLLQCPDPVCQQLNPATQSSCVICGAALTSGGNCLGLEFPWGVVTPDPVLVVGRDPAGVVGPHLAPEEFDRVSRRHAQVTALPGALLVEDLGSTNGTTVNGVPIAAPTEVRAGDLIAFSRALSAVVQAT